MGKILKETLNEIGCKQNLNKFCDQPKLVAQNVDEKNFSICSI